MPRPAPLLALLLLAAPARALEPKDVVVVANKTVPASVEVARHYLAARKVPEANLVLLDLPAAEEMTAADYEAKLAAPLREALKDRRAAVRVLLTVHGVPLRVAGTTPTDAENLEREKLKPALAAAKAALDAAQKAIPVDPKALAAARREVGRLTAEEFKLAHQESQAAVDSELMMLWAKPYPRERFVVNPLHWQYPANQRDGVTLYTARLDGPTPAIAKRLVDDAVAVEAAGGLDGPAVIDARGLKFDPKKPGESGFGYEGYDESFREAAAVLEKAKIPTFLDDAEAVIAKNSRPPLALYGGWYALTNYTPPGKLQRGAVAWHLASFEMGSLKAGNTLWAPNFLADGAAATLGPVAEPYTVGFPKPAEFFGFLVTGEETLVECYAKTVPLVSWQLALVGDPLYTPYRKAKPGKAADVRRSPAGLPALRP